MIFHSSDMANISIARFLYLYVYIVFSYTWTIYFIFLIFVKNEIFEIVQTFWKISYSYVHFVYIRFDTCIHMYLFNFYISISFTYTQIWSNISPPNPSGPVWNETWAGSPQHRWTSCTRFTPSEERLTQRNQGREQVGQNHGTWNHLHYLGVHGSDRT